MAYIAIIFFILCGIEAIYFLWKRNQALEYLELSKKIAQVTRVDKHDLFMKICTKILYVYQNMNILLLPIVLLLLLCNVIIAGILGTILSIIFSFI